MSLTPLLDAFSADPVVRKVVETARRGDAPLVDVAVSPGARSPAAGRARRRRRPPGAGGHRHRPRGRGPRRRAAAASSPPTASPTSRPGRRCRTSGSARAATPSAAGSPCCAGWPTPTRATRRTARSTSSSRRSARCCSRWSRASATWSRSRCAAGDERAARGRRRARWPAAAYTRVDLVERRGEFAVRGGILDVFPPTEEHPLRVEFWGDTVEEVRWFKVADQRSLEVAEHGLWAPPCRELLLTDEVRERAARAGRRSSPAWPRCSASSPRASPSRAWSRSPRCWSTAWSCCSTCCPPGTHVVLCDPERVRTRAARPGRHQRGVPRGVLGQRRRRQRRARSTCRRVLGTASYWAWPTCARTR